MEERESSSLPGADILQTCVIRATSATDSIMKVEIAKQNPNLKVWSHDTHAWNFGDVLVLVLAERLFYDFDSSNAEFRMIGSVISDGLVPQQEPPLVGQVPNWKGRSDCRVVYWGCGIREPQDFCEENYAKVDFLAVRGPISASNLRLGSSVAMGEPGLLLPALYQPKANRLSSGKSICIPHYNDSRPDEYFLEISGCDLVLRPRLKPQLEEVYRFIDLVSSASFVLTAALHGAVTAAAYGVPFAYWDNGHLDLPTKWEDFSRLVGISTHFAKDLASGTSLYKESTQREIALPSLWPLLVTCPFLLRGDGLMSVLRHELERSEPSEYLSHFNMCFEMLQANRQHFSDVAAQVRYFSRERFSQIMEDLEASEKSHASSVSQKNELENRLKEQKEESRKIEEGLSKEILEAVEKLADMERDTKALITSLNEEKDELSRRELALAEQLGRQFEELQSNLDASQNMIDAANAEARAYKVALEAAEQEAMNAKQNMVDKAKADAAACEAALEAAKREALSVSQGMIDAAKADAAAYKVALEAAEREVASYALAVDDQREKEVSRKQNEARLEIIENKLLNIEKRKIARGRSLGFGLISILPFKRPNRSIRLDNEARLICDFIISVDPSKAGAALRDAAIKYLLGLSGSVAGFPYFQDLEYREMYPDVASSGMNPFVHYVLFGRKEERNIHPLLDTKYYFEQYPEARVLAKSAVEHFVRWGAAKGFNPHPLFDVSGYWRRYADVKATGTNPLEHFLKFPRCITHSLFDPGYYLALYPDVSESGRNPLTHYLLHGWREGRDPHPYFKTNYYLSRYPDVAEEKVVPLAHYVTQGALEGRRTCEDFDPDFYLLTYRDIADARLNPLIHYVEHGASEGRLAKRPMAATPQPISLGRPVVTMLDALFPRPDQDSGSLDQIAFIRIFQALGFEVHFIAVLEFGSANFGDNTRYVKALEDMGARCIRADAYDFIEEYMFINGQAISLFFCSRVGFGAEYIEPARRICPHAKIIFNTVDLHHVREEREARLKESEELLHRALATKQRELKLVEAAHATVVVSSKEKEILEQEVPGNNVIVVPLLREFPRDDVVAFGERSGIAFVGGFLHQPNIDAVNYFIEAIWPTIHAQHPEMIFHVVGANMPDDFASKSVAGVEFVGYVEDLGKYLSKVRLTVAPLRYGAGAKGKVVSSLGYGVPAVVTSVAAEGMGLENGVNVLVADSVEEFASKIIHAYENELLWAQLSANGIEFISSNYSIAQGVSIMSSALRGLAIEIPVEGTKLIDQAAKTA